MSKLAEDIFGAAKENEPRLRVSANVDTYGDVQPFSNNKFVKKDMARAEKKVGHIKRAIKGWDGKAVAEEAFRSLQEDLESELKYIEDCKKRMGKTGKKSKPRGLPIK